MGSGFRVSVSTMNTKQRGSPASGLSVASARRRHCWSEVEAQSLDRQELNGTKILGKPSALRNSEALGRLK
jgi:hypothetical protein